LKIIEFAFQIDFDIFLPKIAHLFVNSQSFIFHDAFNGNITNFVIIKI